MIASLEAIKASIRDEIYTLRCASERILNIIVTELDEPEPT
jgi:hypothetical protein